MNDAQLQHGRHWDNHEIDGWIVTEKFDGCRAFWDGVTLWSRGGNAIAIPDSWLDELPDHPLDCELFAGYGKRKIAEAFVKYGRNADQVSLMVFDAPCHPGKYVERIQSVKPGKVVKRIPYTICGNTHHALGMMRQVQSVGGEGLMVRHPDIQWSAGRTSKMLKVKYEA